MHRRYRPSFMRSFRARTTAAFSLPGLAITFKPRAHQLSAVARIVQEPAVGLFLR